jgi:hypothetical protein
LKFGEDVRDVVSYGLEADVQPLSDLLVAIALSNNCQYLFFSEGKLRGKPGDGLNFEALRLGIERCDPEFMLGFYAEDAKLIMVNAITPRPLSCTGRRR